MKFLWLARLNSGCGSSDLERSALSTSLNLVGRASTENLCCGTLDNATCDWKTGTLLKEEIDFAGGLTTFVNTPK